MPKFFDDPDQWFNGSSQKTGKSKGAAGGGSMPSFRPKNKISNNFKASMNAISSPKAKSPPQVMVKISGSSGGADKAQAHATYIGRNGQVELEDEQGNKYKGKEQKQVLEAWEAMGMNPKATSTSRKEAFHIVFSMPNGTNPDAMKAAVKNLVQEEFAGHKYFMAQHLDTKNPHCHVLLCATDDRGARLNPRKKDLHNYRVQFVQKLAEQGVEATAGRKVHRFNSKDSKSQGVYHRDKKKGVAGTKKRPTNQQKKKIEATHKDVLSQYKSYAKKDGITAENKRAVKNMIKSKTSDIQK